MIQNEHTKDNDNIYTKTHVMLKIVVTFNAIFQGQTN